MAFIATAICNSMALWEGIASAMVDLNISRNESYKRSDKHLKIKTTKTTCNYTWKEALVLKLLVQLFCLVEFGL